MEHRGIQGGVHAHFAALGGGELLNGRRGDRRGGLRLGPGGLLNDFLNGRGRRGPAHEVGKVLPAHKQGEAEQGGD